MVVYFDDLPVDEQEMIINKIELYGGFASEYETENYIRSLFPLGVRIEGAHGIRHEIQVKKRHKATPASVRQTFRTENGRTTTLDNVPNESTAEEDGRRRRKKKKRKWSKTTFWRSRG
jgi:hypothetical protein